MKVIDLLNKIANGEHNFGFKYENDEFFYDFDSKRFVDTRFKETLGERYSLDMMLNEEVEIIEEDKKIEKYNTGLGNGEWHEESVRKDILENKNIEDYLIRVMKEVDTVKFKTFEIIDKENI